MTVADNRILTGVVRRERKRKIVVEHVQQVFQVACAAEYIRPRIAPVAHPVAFRCAGHQLHQPDRTGPRHGARIVGRLCRNHGVDQRRGQVMVFRDEIDRR